MELFVRSLQKEIDALDREQVRFCGIGDRSALEPSLLACLEQAEQRTQAHRRLRLNVALNYGGRWDIVQAAQRCVAEGIAITEDTLAHRLCLSDCPEPDLLIRTSGEQRISNFFLWQSAYSEWFFCDTCGRIFPNENLNRLCKCLLAPATLWKQWGG